jgi:hypothetical protein
MSNDSSFRQHRIGALSCFALKKRLRHMSTRAPHPEFDLGMPDAVTMVEVRRPSHDIFDRRLLAQAGGIQTRTDAG